MSKGTRGSPHAASLQEFRIPLGLLQILCVFQLPRTMGILASAWSHRPVKKKKKKKHNFVLRRRSAATLFGLDTFKSVAHRGSEQLFLCGVVSECGHHRQPFYKQYLNTPKQRTPWGHNLSTTQPRGLFRKQTALERVKQNQNAIKKAASPTVDKTFETDGRLTIVLIIEHSRAPHNHEPHGASNSLQLWLFLPASCLRSWASVLPLAEPRRTLCVPCVLPESLIDPHPSSQRVIIFQHAHPQLGHLRNCVSATVPLHTWQLEVGPCHDPDAALGSWSLGGITSRRPLHNSCGPDPLDNPGDRNGANCHSSSRPNMFSIH